MECGDVRLLNERKRSTSGGEKRAACIKLTVPLPERPRCAARYSERGWVDF